MLTDGLFTLRKFDIRCNVNDTFHLIPFGDVHRDSHAFAKDKWQEFLEHCKSTTNPLFLGMGDYTDSFSTSERVILGNDKLHETTKRNFEETVRAKIASLAHELEFMKGNMLGILGGNHYIQFSDGTTGDMYLANLLDTQYLGAATAFRITFHFSKTHKTCVDIFAHHGKGTGQTTTGRMIAPEKMTQICEADIFLMGHNHARGVLPIGDKLRIETSTTGLCIRSRNCWIGRTGGFLRGYVDGETSYIVDGALPPTSLGWIEFTLKPKRARVNGQDRQTVEIGAVQ